MKIFVCEIWRKGRFVYQTLETYSSLEYLVVEIENTASLFTLTLLNCMANTNLEKWIILLCYNDKCDHFVNKTFVLKIQNWKQPFNWSYLAKLSNLRVKGGGWQMYSGFLRFTKKIYRKRKPEISDFSKIRAEQFSLIIYEDVYIDICSLVHPVALISVLRKLIYFVMYWLGMVGRYTKNGHSANDCRWAMEGTGGRIGEKFHQK